MLSDDLWLSDYLCLTDRKHRLQTGMHRRSDSTMCTRSFCSAPDVIQGEKSAVRFITDREVHRYFSVLLLLFLT